MKWYNKLLLLLLIGINTQHIQALTIEETKGTALIGDQIPLEYKYSISIGAVYAETPILENLTRYAPEGNIKTLLTNLFNTTTQTFRTTKNNKYFGKNITPKIIGQIVNLVFVQKKNKSEVKEELLADIGKRKKNNAEQLITTIFDALEEENAKDSFYPKNIVLYILYGFVYKKAQSKEELRIYFDELCKGATLANSNPSPSLKKKGKKENTTKNKKSTWNTDLFDKKELENAIINGQIFNKDLTKTIAIGLKQNWSSTPLTYDTRLFIPKSKRTFADCVEITLYNICNLLHSQNKAKNFPEILNKFFNDTNKEIMPNQQWLEKIIKKNIPYATYNLLAQKTNIKIREKNDFIYIPNKNDNLLTNSSIDENGFYTITLNNKRYKAFTEESGWSGYELCPNNQNLAIALNHILDHNKPSEDTIDEWYKKPIQKIKDTLEYIGIDNVQTKQEKTSEKTTTIIKFYLNEELFEILINKGHIEINSIKQQSENSKKNQDIIQKLPLDKISNPLVNEISLSFNLNIASKSHQNILFLNQTLHKNIDKIKAPLLFTLKNEEESSPYQKEVIQNILEEYNLIIDAFHHHYKAFIQMSKKIEKHIKNHFTKEALKTLQDKIAQKMKKQIEAGEKFSISNMLGHIPEFAEILITENSPNYCEKLAIEITNEMLKTIEYRISDDDNRVDYRRAFSILYENYSSKSKEKLIEIIKTLYTNNACHENTTSIIVKNLSIFKTEELKKLYTKKKNQDILSCIFRKEISNQLSPADYIKSHLQEPKISGVLWKNRDKLYPQNLLYSRKIIRDRQFNRMFLHHPIPPDNSHATPILETRKIINTLKENNNEKLTKVIEYLEEKLAQGIKLSQQNISKKNKAKCKKAINWIVPISTLISSIVLEKKYYKKTFNQSVKASIIPTIVATLYSKRYNHYIPVKTIFKSDKSQNEIHKNAYIYKVPIIANIASSIALGIATPKMIGKISIPNYLKGHRANKKPLKQVRHTTI